MENLRPNGDRKSAEVEHASVLPKTEGQRHWDKDGLRMTHQWPPHQYPEGQSNATRSQFRGQTPHSDMGLEKRIEQDMEVGYEDSPSPLTLEALEKKFHDETMRLAKEESDADNAENARHREKKTEISKMYQEKLSALRALQAKQREEFLNKETQDRLNQYRQQEQQQQQQHQQQLLHQQQFQHQQLQQQLQEQPQQHRIPNNYPMDRDPRAYRPHPADSIPGADPRGYDPRHYPTDIDTIDPRLYGPNHYPAARSPADPRGYGRPASIEPPLRSYAPGPHELYRERERSPYSQVQRNQDAEGRVPIPQGRSYNNTRARNI